MIHWRPYRIARSEVVEDCGDYVVMRDYLEPNDRGPIMVRFDDEMAPSEPWVSEYRVKALPKPI